MSSRTIAIGVHDQNDPERLRSTLNALAVTAPSAEVLVITDRPSAAAAFNQLAKSTRADVVVLLESGCVTADGWLERLLRALDADPRNGLAGPSTNNAWNEQGAFRGASGAPADIAATARDAAITFGDRWRTLEPLHSLAEFCYLVERRVIDAVGVADEEYDDGPCWEMDYNIRAARRGFLGVWACGAYVFRPPATEHKRRREQQLFMRNKQHYQDKFCGRRQADPAAPYRSHCRGDACGQFAVSSAPQIVQVQPRALVSCIMPTRDRPEFVRQAVSLFARQDYAERELIVVDDGDRSVEHIVAHVPNARYIRVAERGSIGAKRNRACTEARGTVIVQWDDDDWYAANRLTRQVQPILDGRADVTAFRAGIVADLTDGTFWQCDDALHRRLFVGNVHGGTLAFHRDVWARKARYPDRSIAEDAAFLRQAQSAGAVLLPLANDNSFIYTRHGTNSWALRCGHGADGWRAVSGPDWSAEDAMFYRTLSAAEPFPSVTCVMPTADRPAFAQRAVEYFLRQDYPRCELLVLDNGRDPVRNLLPSDPRITYRRTAHAQTLGEKRNAACEQAAGTVIVHWDDDDWMAPSRVSDQVATLRRHGTDVTGLSRVRFLDAGRQRAWTYEYTGARTPWVYGGTLCYSKTAWRRTPFTAVNVGEDNQFVWAQGPSAVTAVQEASFYVALIHRSNTSPKRIRDRYWRECALETVQALMGGDWLSYQVDFNDVGVGDAAAAAL
jgi:glycosyltransferase involved in cell wall biosynthesis